MADYRKMMKNRDDVRYILSLLFWQNPTSEDCDDDG